MSKNINRKNIRLLLGWEPIEVHSINPNTTVLQFLRDHLNLIGTKEGCAEGDCGACTIIVGEAKDRELHYKAVNACILFLPFVDGKQILTVEHVATKVLHPVQLAMVDLHGTQCGFCTPGIIMSLVAHHLNRGGKTRREIDDVLAGNLCRCTGYGTIIDAARQALKEKTLDVWGKNISAALLHLLEWKTDQKALRISKSGMEFFAPQTLDQLNEILADNPESTIIAGMTDVGLWVTKGGKQLDTLVSLLQVEGLEDIKLKEEGIEIYAAVTYNQVKETLAKVSPSLGELNRRIGGTQIRNTGTVCGNIANGSPIGDMSPPLIALDSSIVLRSTNGRREIPLEDFFIGYGVQDLRASEFVEQIRIPALRGIFRCYKISKRFDQDISAVLGAFKLEIEGGKVKSARIAFGGMASTPKRAERCEEALIGSLWGEEAIKYAKIALDRDFDPINDVRASGDYRTLVARNLVEKFFLETQNCPEPLQLADRTTFETH